MRSADRVPQEMRQVYENIVGLTDDFCQAHLNIGILNPKWCLPSKLADNPLAWMISVNGFMVDARHAPREIQEEAFRLGLNPYLP